MERILIRSQDLLQGIPAEVSDHQIGEGYTAVVLSADVQATVEALQAQLEAANTLLYKKNCAIGKAETTIEALQAQLPAEMQGCTILFKECEKGHGRLVATNWRDHGCQTCEVEALQRERLREALREIAYDDIDLMQARALALTALTPAAKGGNGE